MKGVPGGWGAGMGENWTDWKDEQMQTEDRYRKKPRIDKERKWQKQIAGIYMKKQIKLLDKKIILTFC